MVFLMPYILPLLYTAFFIFLIYKLNFFTAAELPKKAIAGIFILKIFFGVVLWAIYTYHYTYRQTSDAFRFYDDAVIIFNATKGHFLHFLQIVFGLNSDAAYLKPYLADTNSWFRPYDYGLLNDDRTLIRFNALVLFFSFGCYHVHTVFMNFISLIGLVALYKTFIKILPERKLESAAAIFFIPTVIFWGSGVLKEGLLLFGLGLFVYQLYTVTQQKITLKNGSILLLSIMVLMLVKIYILICLIPSAISILLLKYISKQNKAIIFMVTHILCFAVALNIHCVFPEYDVLATLQTKQKDFYNVAELWNAGSAIDIGRLEPYAWSFIQNSPRAFFTTLFRPHLLEANNLFLFIAALENLLFAAIIIFYFFHFKKPDKNMLHWFLMCVSFVVLLSLLIGLTTPIMGAIVRYKLPSLPFLIFIFLFISEKPERTLKYFNR